MRWAGWCEMQHTKSLWIQSLGKQNKLFQLAFVAFCRWCDSCCCFDSIWNSTRWANLIEKFVDSDGEYNPGNIQLMGTDERWRATESITSAAGWRSCHYSTEWMFTLLGMVFFCIAPDGHPALYTMTIHFRWHTLNDDVKRINNNNSKRDNIAVKEHGSAKKETNGRHSTYKLLIFFSRFILFCFFSERRTMFAVIVAFIVVVVVVCWKL